MQQIKIQKTITNRTEALNSYLADIARYPMVTPEEEVELARRIRSGDTEALHTLVCANLRFVVSVAKQYAGQGMELSDIITFGNIGLMKAAEKFDDTLGFKFISYAVWWIRQSILQGISEQGRMVRLPLNQMGNINKIRKATAAFMQEEMREPSASELSEMTGIIEEKVKETGRVSGTHVSMDAPFGDEEGDGTLLDVLHDTSSPAADTRVMKESLSTDIERALATLPQREAIVLKKCFGIGCQEMSLEEIAEDLDLTRERVRQIREKAVRKLRKSAVMIGLKQYL